MKQILLATTALGLSASAACAAGLDRSGQNTSAIFNDSGTVSLSFGVVRPNVTGKDDAGNDYDVGKQYTQTALSYTRALNEQFSFAVIVDQPFGALVDYNNDPSSSTLGGTGADLSSEALSHLGKYQASSNLSFYGGFKVQRVRADVALSTSYANASVSGLTDGFAPRQIAANGPDMDAGHCHPNRWGSWF